MSDDFRVTIELDPSTEHGQRYAGIVKSAKYLNTDNINKVWQLVQELHRQQRASRQNEQS